VRCDFEQGDTRTAVDCHVPDGSDVGMRGRMCHKSGEQQQGAQQESSKPDHDAAKTHGFRQPSDHPCVQVHAGGLRIEEASNSIDCRSGLP
jgi:hypothetical protein